MKISEQIHNSATHKPGFDESCPVCANLRAYLGDGVYAEFHYGMVRVYTSDGLTQTNEIFLDNHVLESLVEFAKRIGVMR